MYLFKFSRIKPFRMEVIGVKYFTENITGVASKGQIIHFRFTENIEHALPRLIPHLLCHVDNFFLSTVYLQFKNKSSPISHNGGGYFMYFVPNVRPWVGDHVTRI